MFTLSQRHLLAQLDLLEFDPDLSCFIEITAWGNQQAYFHSESKHHLQNKISVAWQTVKCPNGQPAFSTEGDGVRPAPTTWGGGTRTRTSLLAALILILPRSLCVFSPLRFPWIVAVSWVTLYPENYVPPEFKRNLQLGLIETYFSPDYVCIWRITKTSLINVSLPFVVSLFFNAVMNWKKRPLVLLIIILYVVSPAYYDSKKRCNGSLYMNWREDLLLVTLLYFFSLGDNTLIKTFKLSPPYHHLKSVSLIRVQPTIQLFIKYASVHEISSRIP